MQKSMTLDSSKLLTVRFTVNGKMRESKVDFSPKKGLSGLVLKKKKKK
jgi:hypothetical protein